MKRESWVSVGEIAVMACTITREAGTAGEHGVKRFVYVYSLTFNLQDSPSSHFKSFVRSHSRSKQLAETYLQMPQPASSPEWPSKSGLGLSRLRPTLEVSCNCEHRGRPQAQEDTYGTPKPGPKLQHGCQNGSSQAWKLQRTWIKGCG